jgi:competence protein ComEC
MRVLDVGQGDAILLEPRDAAPILVDAGPPDGGVAARLAELGIERLGAVAITHDQLDHAGGLAELLGAVEVGRLIVAPGALPELCERSPCPPRHRVERGDALRAGRLRLEVLWPPAGAPAPGADPNARSLVLHARLGKFDALLAGDAEAEAAPVDPGPVEVLKVAHHGSADSSLPALLVRSVPELAVVSVGDGNAYGHPAPETLAALAEAGVPVLRTDEHGEAVISVGNDGWAVG